MWYSDLQVGDFFIWKDRSYLKLNPVMYATDYYSYITHYWDILQLNPCKLTYFSDSYQLKKIKMQLKQKNLFNTYSAYFREVKYDELFIYQNGLYLKFKAPWRFGRFNTINLETNPGDVLFVTDDTMVQKSLLKHKTDLNLLNLYSELESMGIY